MNELDKACLMRSISKEYASALVNKKLIQLKDEQAANPVLLESIKQGIYVDEIKKSFNDFLNGESMYSNVLTIIILIVAETNYIVCNYFFDCDFITSDLETRTLHLFNV